MQRLISFSILALLLLTPDLAKAEDSPVALLIGPEHIIAGGTVLFDGSFSYHEGSTYHIVNYKWYVNGMEQSDVEGDKTFTYTFSSVGSYTVELKVFSSNNTSTDTELITVEVSAAPGRYYYLTDHLGSVRATVNENGDVVGYDDYYPFGLQMAKRSGVGDDRTREKFTGHELDGETGLLYAGARYYMPEVGRWMSVDPVLDEAKIEFLITDKYLSATPYNYVFSDPVNLRDPDGKCPSCVIGAAVGGVIGGVSAYLEGSDITTGLIAGATSGAIAGLAVDLTVATGGLALVVGGAVGGAAGGAVGDVISQVGNDLADGLGIVSAVQNLDGDQVLQSAEIGGVAGLIGGAGGALIEGAAATTPKIIEFGKVALNKVSSSLFKSGAQVSVVHGAQNQIVNGIHAAAMNTANNVRNTELLTTISTATGAGRIQFETNTRPNDDR